MRTDPLAGPWSWAQRASLVVVGLACVAVAFAGLIPVYADYKWGDYGEAMAAVRARARADDVIVLNGPWQDLLYRRYGVGLPTGHIIASTVPLEAAEATGWLARFAAEHPRLWVIDSATDEADPNGVVVAWLDRNAYPEPVSTFQKALLRPYLTDSGGQALVARAGVVWPAVLGLQIDQVALGGWSLRPEDEARLRVRARSVGPEPGPELGEGARMVARLMDGAGVTWWHWDGAFADVDGGLEFRAGLTLPREAADGTYRLQLIVYRAERGADGSRRVSQISDAIEAGLVEVRR